MISLSLGLITTHLNYLIMNGIWNYLGTLIFLAAFLGIRGGCSESARPAHDAAASRLC